MKLFVTNSSFSEITLISLQTAQLYHRILSAGSIEGLPVEWFFSKD